MRKHYDKIMAILVIGSIWGAMEIFGYRLLTSLNASHKSPYLFAIAILIMIAAKRIAPFVGSTFPMALIAGFYKVLTFSLPACGSNAVMALLLDSAAFEIVYTLTRTQLETSFWRRTLAAPLIAIIAYLSFGVYAQYINPEATALSPSFQGLITYMKTSAVYAAILSLATIHFGFSLGDLAYRSLNATSSRTIVGLSRAIGLVLALGAWAARFI